ncbi:pectinesterase family protein [Fulvivirga ulvae]|uniref:pectinesterase family protein n=1 Tax=Fulvivirga ulvae TaxID=2904245 RepID=UPI001F434B58|nr:pectinesterase family protein [Fulvivirga ulvae]UII31812.1 pectinesterase family protein [Fulvivirga ulvae]
MIYKVKLTWIWCWLSFCFIAVATAGANGIPKILASDYYKVVALDSSGDYTSIQEAINSSKAFPYQRVIIKIKNGIYREKVRIYAWNPHVSLIGEDKEKTIIAYDDHFKRIDQGRNSTFHTATLAVEGNNFYASNLTIQNTAGNVGQAIALSVNANKVVIENCNIEGNQDTLYTSGEGFRQYFDRCHIEGTTDFIFGNATVLFTNCTIHSKADSYITAASTPQNEPFGYVFMHCTLTADEQVNKVYLGRPWRKYAKTVFVETAIGDHVVAEGWSSWSGEEANDAFYAEYNCTGPGYKPEARVSWSHQLTAAEATKYNLDNILGTGTAMSEEPWYLLTKTKTK